MEESRCSNCDVLIYEPHGEPRSPCPACGHTGRTFEVKLESSVSFYDGHRIQAFKAGESKFYLDERSDPSYYRVDDQWHHLVRIIDREHDRYIETIRILSSGELIKHVDMPLTEHFGHGGSRNQGGEP